MLKNKQIDNSIFVLDILRNVSRIKELQASAIFSADYFEQGTLLYLRKEKKIFFKPNKPSNNFIIGKNLIISFLLKETIFEFESPVLAISNSLIQLALPKIFKSSFERKYSRYSPNMNDDIYVKLPDNNNYSVKDINTAGVSFYSTNLNFEIDHLIRNICVFFNNTEVCIDAKIKYILPLSDSSILYGTEFVNIDWFANYALFKYIFENTYPNIKEITDFSKESIYNLYEESDYFKIKPREEINKYFNSMYELINRIKIYPSIISNPVFYHNDKIYMGASALRLYNNTFLAQHLAAVPSSRLFPSSKTSVYLGLNDYFLCNPHFNYYLTYYDATNKWHHKMYQSIGSYIDDEKKFIYETSEYFECYYKKYTYIENELQCVILDDTSEFIDFANNNISQLHRNSYGYTKKDIAIGELKQLYEMAGLFAQRQIIKISDNNRVIAYGVVETYTSGLNLFNLLDMVRLYIVDKDYNLNDLFVTIINECKFFFERYNKSKFNIFVKLDEGKKDLINIEGVKYNCLAGTIMANREGSIEYKNLFLNMTR